MPRDDYPPEFIKRVDAVRGKRSRIVVDHILKHGQITSEELQRTYGYEHPPRAVRDVREQGIPIETFMVENADGKPIAAYRFGDPTKVRNHVLNGRRVLPKKLKRSLLEQHGARCLICLCEYEDRYLQIDHRIPYEVAGDQTESELDPAEFMLVCGSCNRAKSWSCEHCPNWSEDQSPDVCIACYWANPEDYKHLALRQIRRLEVVWTNSEVEMYDRLCAKAKTAHSEMPDYVKHIVERHLKSQ